LLKIGVFSAFFNFLYIRGRVSFCSARKVQGRQEALREHHAVKQALPGPEGAAVAAGDSGQLRRQAHAVSPHERRERRRQGQLRPASHAPAARSQILLPAAAVGPADGQGHLRQGRDLPPADHFARHDSQQLQPDHHVHAPRRGAASQEAHPGYGGRDEPQHRRTKVEVH
jgi:hypothetical protein